MLTPSSGIVRTNPDIEPIKCPECAKPLAMTARYPRPVEYRCVNRGCSQNAFPEVQKRIPTFSELGWL